MNTIKTYDVVEAKELFDQTEVIENDLWAYYPDTVYPNFETAAGSVRTSKLDMFQSGIFGPREVNDTSLKMLHEEAKDIATVRLENLIKLREAAKPMEDADFDGGTEKAAEIASSLQKGGQKM